VWQLIQRGVVSTEYIFCQAARPASGLLEADF
jgi:hypothetical protein